MRRSRHVLAAVAFLALGTALRCAPLRGSSAHREVQETILARSGHDVTWDRLTQPEPAVQERIAVLLENELTVENAVDVALLGSRRLQATFEELEIARADMVQAWLPRNPLLGGEIRFPGEPSRPFELTITQSLLDLIQLRARRGLAEAAFEPAKLRAADEVLRFVSDVRKAYFTVQAAEQVVKMLEEVVEAAGAAAELAIRQHEAGNISELDLENEQALLDQSKLELAQARTVAQDDREQLNRLMGLWGPQTAWRIPPGLRDPPAVEPDLEGLESLAVAQRLDLAAAQREIEAAARAKPLARARAIGEIDVGVHHEREPEGSSTTGPAFDVSLPIVHRGRPARVRAEAVLRQSQQRYAALAVEIRSEVRAARNRLLAARGRAEYYSEVVVPRRERIVAQSLLHYNFMLLGQFELLLARQNEIAARRGYMEALRDYWVGRSELEVAVGGRLADGGNSR